MSDGMNEMARREKIEEDKKAQKEINEIAKLLDDFKWGMAVRIYEWKKSKEEEE